MDGPIPCYCSLKYFNCEQKINYTFQIQLGSLVILFVWYGKAISIFSQNSSKLSLPSAFIYIYLFRIGHYDAQCRLSSCFVPWPQETFSKRLHDISTPKFSTPSFKPRNFQSQTLQPWTFQPQTFQLWIFELWCCSWLKSLVLKSLGLKFPLTNLER